MSNFFSVWRLGVQQAYNFLVSIMMVRINGIVNRHTVGRRLETVKHGLLTAAKEDGATLVWFIRTLYNLPGLRQAFDVALLQDLRKVIRVVDTRPR